MSSNPNASADSRRRPSNNLVQPETKVRTIRAGQLARRLDIDLSSGFFTRVGFMFIRVLAEEARRDFSLRKKKDGDAWSMTDPAGGPPLDKSFSFEIVGGKTIHVKSSFWGLHELVNGLPERKMVWLTQEAKEQHPEKYNVTARERRLGRRLPLVVPMEDASGTVIFRMAPLTTNEAWIHPGIAKFGFMERGAKRAREELIRMAAEDVLSQLPGALVK